MRNQTQQDITIGKEVLLNGIGPSSVFGIKQVQNMDIFNIDGVARANFEIFATLPPAVTTTFTADAGTDILTVASTFRWTMMTTTVNAFARAVTVSSTGTLPTGLTAGTIYFIIDVTFTTIKLATTAALAEVGTAIDITTNGTGTLTITSVDPARFNHYAAWQASGAVETYAQDANGRLWYYNTGLGWNLIVGNTLTSATGQGLAIWKNYLFAFRTSAVDVYGPLTNSFATRTWSNSWAGGTSLSGTGIQRTDHITFVSQNGRLYFANQSSGGVIPYVGSLQENVGFTFDPATAGTYTWNSSALDLPDYEFINDFEELNGKLQTATVVNKIYPWDKVSDSFDAPIVTSEPNVKCLKVLNNTMYYGCGYRGNVYRTYGTTSEIVLDFSDDLSNYPQTTAQCLDLEIYQGNILAAITGATAGVYMIDVNNSNRYSIFNTLTNSSAYPETIFTGFNSTASSYIPYQYFVSWYISGQSTVGVDANVFRGYGPYRATSDKPYIITELIRIGDDSNNPRKLETIEVFLRKAITSGHSVKVQFRFSESETFANGSEFTYINMTDGDYLAGWDKVDMKKARWVQMKIIISIPSPSNGTFSQFNTPEVAEVRTV